MESVLKTSADKVDDTGVRPSSGAGISAFRRANAPRLCRAANASHRRPTLRPRRLHPLPVRPASDHYPRPPALRELSSPLVPSLDTRTGLPCRERRSPSISRSSYSALLLGHRLSRQPWTGSTPRTSRRLDSACPIRARAHSGSGGMEKRLFAGSSCSPFYTNWPNQAMELTPGRRTAQLLDD